MFRGGACKKLAPSLHKGHHDYNDLKEIQMSVRKAFVIRDGASRAVEWKAEFIAKASEQYPCGVRERRHGIKVCGRGQHVRVKATPIGPNLLIETRYGSIVRAFATLFLVIGLFTILGSLAYYLSPWNYYWGPLQSPTWSGIPSCITIAIILFVIDHSVSMHDRVLAIAKAAWEDVLARDASPNVSAPIRAPVIQLASIGNTGAGSVTATMVSPEIPMAVYCASCGARIRPGAHFCELCGEEI